MPAIERWFRLRMEHTPPFYCSVDIRNAGFKLAPVDTNLFPGGWNNLTDEMLPLAAGAMAAIEKICPEARNLLIIPENHTATPIIWPACCSSSASSAWRASMCASAPSAPRSEDAVHHAAAGRRPGAGAGDPQQAPPGLKDFDPAPSC
jgi:hypothetical protein